MKPFSIGRRTLLRGLGSIGVALPLLDVMEPLRSARAQLAAPRRFVAIYEQSGIVYDRWKPSGSGTSFSLQGTLAPLEGLRSKVVVLDGLTNEAAKHGPGDDHSKGMGSMLTGTELLGTNDALGLAGGISVDQAIANDFGTSTKFKSLELGVQSGAGGVLNYMSYAGPGEALPSVSDPAEIYKRVFGSFSAPSSDGPSVDPALERLIAERRSVLDAVSESYADLLPKVSSDDRLKLDAHLTQIRALETRLTASPDAPSSALAACEKPAQPTIDAKKNDNFPTIAELQMDLLVMALACDLTRVGCVQFSRESADPVYSWLGHSRGHHTISHDDDTNTTSLDQLAEVDRWHAEQVNYFASKLDEIAEGGATMLDNTLVVWVNGLAKGNWHSHGSDPPQPIVTVGGAGGAVKTGQVLSVQGSTTNDFLVSCLNAMGIEASTFGNDAYCKGALPGFLV